MVDISRTTAIADYSCWINLKPALAILRQRVDELAKSFIDNGGSIQPLNSPDELMVNKALELCNLPPLGTTSDVSQSVRQTGTNRPQPPSTQDSFAHLPGSITTPTAGIHTPPTPTGQQHVLDAPYSGGAMDLSFTGSDMSTSSLWAEGAHPDWPFLGLNGAMIDFTSHFGLQAPFPAEVSTVEDIHQDSVGAERAMRSDSSSEEEDDDQDLVDQISARIGSLRIAPDGRLRYFGAQANAYLLTTNTTPSSSPPLHASQTDRNRLLRNAGVQQHAAPDFVDHLIDLYFRYFNTCHPVVQKSTYEHARSRWEKHEDHHGYYSETLTNAM